MAGTLTVVFREPYTLTSGRRFARARATRSVKKHRNETELSLEVPPTRGAFRGVILHVHSTLSAQMDVRGKFHD